MDKDLQTLLEKNIALAEENNRLLKRLARAARFGLVVSIIKWVIIIGSAFGLYYYFGQFFGSTWEIYKNLLFTPNQQSGQSSDLGELEMIFNQLKNSL